MTRCNSCCALKIALENTKGHKEETIQIRNALKTHYRVISAERQVLSSWQIAARDGNVLLVKADGYSKDKTKLPSVPAIRAKKISDTDLVPSSLYAVMAYSSGESSNKQIYVYSNFLDGYSTNGSYVFSTIVNTLLNLEFLPRTIVLNFDNARSQKGMLILRSLGLLVHSGIVDEIILEYMFAGHTHNEVDAFFGALSQKWKNRDIWTYACMAEVISGMSDVTYLSRLFPVYCTDFVMDDRVMFRAFSQYIEKRSFSIIRLSGETVLRAKDDPLCLNYDYSQTLIKDYPDYSKVLVATSKFATIPSNEGPVASLLKNKAPFFPKWAFDQWKRDADLLHSSNAISHDEFPEVLRKLKLMSRRTDRLPCSNHRVSENEKMFIRKLWRN